ncbi:GntR family transcriptional regulator [Proteiniclasticum sp. C24MP]|uniref:GntR family transcriptional regulator n=1 Tax=Proteiniclasticum sp. C24MP TaxID=3374101 RepID=UPI0037544BD2
MMIVGANMIIREKDPRERASEFALRVLRENIIMLELKPGTLVSENELAQVIGLSRTPIREALIELSKVEIVEILPQKGVFISNINQSLVEEARFIRTVLETAVIKEAAQKASPEYIMKLEECIKLQRYYLDNHNPEKLLELDDEFHQLIFNSVDKNHTYKLMSSMMIHFDRVRNLSLQTIKDIRIVEDHERIFKAIKEKDVVEAVKGIREHLGRYQLDKNEIMESYKELFL